MRYSLGASRRCAAAAVQGSVGSYEEEMNGRSNALSMLARNRLKGTTVERAEALENGELPQACILGDPAAIFHDDTTVLLTREEGLATFMVNICMEMVQGGLSREWDRT